jgi:hypothetical protein
MEAMKGRLHPGFVRVSMGALVVLILSGISVVPVAAREVAINPGDELMVSVLRIDDKAPDFNYVFIGERRFRVATTAEIVGYGGPIPLVKLRIPCRAEITYQLFGDNRDPMIYKIRIK